MRRLLIAAISVLLAAGAARAQEEDVNIRGNFPQLLARGESLVQMANRIAVLLVNLDRRIAPPCGMKRIFTFAGADHVDESDLSVRVDPAKPGVWRLVVTGKGCWSPRMHNVFVVTRGALPADLRLGVPGRSVAGPKLQGEAIRLVLREANGIAMRSKCEDPAFLVDTSVAKVRKAGAPWAESWSASACEVTRRFAVMFTPEGQKTRIAVALSN